MEVQQTFLGNNYMLALTMKQSAEWIESIILHMIKNKIDMSRVAINIGANDGITLDPLHLLYLKNDYTGLCIEADTSTVAKLKNNLPKTVDILHSFITPNDILNIEGKFLNSIFFLFNH